MNENNAIALWLAASRFSEDDLYEFFRYVVKDGPESVTRRLYELRNSTQGAPAKTPRAPVIDDSDRLRINEHMSMISSVEKLLLGDAKLSKADATHIIMSELQDIDTQYGYLSSPNKKSFRSWLARIGEDVSDSRILHIASRIRNEIVHGKRSVSDWPI